MNPKYIHVRHLVAVGLALSATLTVAVPAHAAPKPSITKDAEPFVQCSWKDTDGSWVSVFGYKTPISGSIAIGEDNMFTPVPKDRDQPTDFDAGVDYAAVVVRHSGTLMWHLGGGQAKAPSDDTCPSNPMSMVGSPWSAAAWIAIAAACGGAWSFLRRRRQSHAGTGDEASGLPGAHA